MAISVPDICDEYFDRVRVLEPWFTDFGAKQKFSGEIVTVKCFEDNSLVKDLVGTNGRGRVIVVDGGGSMRRALLGALLAAEAAKNAWQGLLINGCVRDVEILQNIDLGIKALNSHPVKTDKRGEGRQDIAIEFGGVRIEPGQFLYADANGVVVADRDLELDF
jgi:regulator of ribonuclease activity A